MSRLPSTRSSAAGVGTDPTPREAYHHGALRDALIDATEALIAERGAQGVEDHLAVFCCVNS